MTEQDQARIAAIEKYLEQLNLLVPELKPYQPISTEGLVYGFDTNPLGVDIKPPIASVEPNTIAQTEPIKEERWNVSVQPFKHNSNDNRIVIYYNDGILSGAEAYKIADKIKQLLTTL